MSISEDDRLYRNSSQEGPCFEGQQIAAIGGCPLQQRAGAQSLRTLQVLKQLHVAAVWRAKQEAQANCYSRAAQVEKQVLAAVEQGHGG